METQGGRERGQLSRLDDLIPLEVRNFRRTVWWTVWWTVCLDREGKIQREKRVREGWRDQLARPAFPASDPLNSSHCAF